MNVLLYQVGRNLNRVYRTCEAFGVERLLLLDCPEAKLTGNLYKATGRVVVEEIFSWPSVSGLSTLETWAKPSITEVNWNQVQHIVLGGETNGLSRKLQSAQWAHIPMIGKISGLTVEAALAIALYEWRRKS